MPTFAWIPFDWSRSARDPSSITPTYFGVDDPGYYYAWYLAVGCAVDPNGDDIHGAGAVRFDTKEEGGPGGESPEVVFHCVRLVRGGSVTNTPDGDPTTVDPDRIVDFDEGVTGRGGRSEDAASESDTDVVQRR